MTQKKDIIPKDLTELLKTMEGYADDKAMRTMSRYDPNEDGIPLAGSSDCRQRGEMMEDKI